MIENILKTKTCWWGTGGVGGLLCTVNNEIRGRIKHICEICVHTR